MTDETLNTTRRAHSLSVAVTTAVDRLALDQGLSPAETAHGTLLSSITIAERLIGMPRTVEWLRDIADQFEAQLLRVQPAPGIVQ